MPVIRVEKQDNYTSMSNYHLRDKRLSLRAIGLLSKMLSLPPDWDYTVNGLADICREGRDAVRATLIELEANGYMIRQQTHTGSGTFSKNDYIVYEIPKTAPLTENPSTVNPSTVEPSTAEPSTAEPLTGKSTQINTDLSKDLLNIPPIVPQAGDGLPVKKAKRSRARREAKQEPDWKPERFAAFWEAYPRGESKQAAIAAWDKLMPDDALLVVMAKGLKRQMQTEEWQRGIGIPYASTWLNQRRWEDDLGKQSAAEPDNEDGGGLPVWT